MGELIELSTWPEEIPATFPVRASAMFFEVKCGSVPQIYLHTYLDKIAARIDLLLNLQLPSCHILNTGSGDAKSYALPVSQDGYQKFWLSWYGDTIRLGEQGVSLPFAELSSKDFHSMGYVSFCASSEVAHWRFEVAPLIPKPVSVEVKALEWMPFNGHLPRDALIAGYQNEPIYIARAPHGGSTTPGKYLPSKSMAYIGWSWIEHPKTEFEVLCGYQMSWVPAAHGKVPAGAFVGGYSENSFQERLCIGRAEHEGHTIVGKVQESHGCCFIPYNGREILKRTYEVLVVQPKTFHNSTR